MIKFILGTLIHNIAICFGMLWLLQSDMMEHESLGTKALSAVVYHHKELPFSPPKEFLRYRPKRWAWVTKTTDIIWRTTLYLNKPCTRCEGRKTNAKLFSLTKYITKYIKRTNRYITLFITPLWGLYLVFTRPYMTNLWISTHTYFLTNFQKGGSQCNSKKKKCYRRLRYHSNDLKKSFIFERIDRLVV